MSAPILITIPKFVTIPTRNGVPICPDSDDPIDEFLIRGKKRRLDHLTWEEKFQRKKLKNRVAAQTSRDRKKARMDEMELTIKNLDAENSSLKEKCNILTTENKELLGRHIELERQVAELIKRLDEKQPTTKLAEHSVGCGTSTIGSAVSFDPLPQGLEPQSTPRSADKNTNGTIALWKIIALCLLYRTCSKTSMPPDLKNLQKVCSRMSSQTWQTMLLAVSKQMPKMKATQSECLDQWWGPEQNTWNPPKIRVTV